MRGAHTVAEVRTAETALMAQVPDGALMQRAAAGLAAICASVLERVYGAQVVVLAGSGDNGGDALYAGARLAGRGARVIAVAAGSRLHEAATAALLTCGGRVVAASSEPTGSNASPSPSPSGSPGPSVGADRGRSAGARPGDGAT